MNKTWAFISPPHRDGELSLPSGPLSWQQVHVQGGVVCRTAGGSAAGPPHAVLSVFPSFPALPWHPPVCSSPCGGIFLPLPCFLGEGAAGLTLLRWSSRLDRPAAWLGSEALACVPSGLWLAAEQEWASRYQEWDMQGGCSPSLFISRIFWVSQFPTESAGLHFLARCLLLNTQPRLTQLLG